MWKYQSVRFDQYDIFLSVDPAGVNHRTDVVDYGVSEYRATSLLFGVRLRRLPRYYVLNLILPTVMLALLSVFVFIIPADSGEKMSYAITILLAFFIFLLLLSGNIPPTSKGEPLLGEAQFCIDLTFKRHLWQYPVYLSKWLVPWFIVC